MDMMIKLGSKVRHQNDEGWAAPGCVISTGIKFRVYWPDENLFTDEFPDNLAAYGMDVASQPLEISA